MSYLNTILPHVSKNVFSEAPGIHGNEGGIIFGTEAGKRLPAQGDHPGGNWQCW